MQEFDLVTCRRVNYLQAAMVQAAISIQRAHGREIAAAVLAAEHLPAAVINRVLDDSTRKRQSPYTSRERPD